MLCDTARLRPSPNVQLDVLDGEIVLFHVARLEVLHLNRSATLIWHLCDGQRTIAEMCAILADAYPSAAGQIRDDVERTLRVLQEKGALVAESAEVFNSTLGLRRCASRRWVRRHTGFDRFRRPIAGAASIVHLAPLRRAVHCSDECPSAGHLPSRVGR